MCSSDLFLQGIILSPDYQREYRSKAKEESSIIESIIVGIPIPEIFLVRTGAVSYTHLDVYKRQV